MNTSFVCLLVCLVAAMPIADVAGLDNPTVVEIDKGGKRMITLGQTAHFIHRYDGFAGKIITGLEVAVNGTAVEKPKIISKPDPQMVDVGQIVFVFRPEKAGVYRIKVQTLTGTVKGTCREYVLEVTEMK